MKVALFVPCYVDQLWPQAGLATLDVLERLGVQVEYPDEQTCCGQPMANSGFGDDARPLARRFVDVFAGYDAVVAPSGSCVSMVRNHYGPLVGDLPAYPAVARSTYELCEFLVDVLHVDRLDGRFARRVGLHQSCHGLRELRLGSGSERMIPRSSKVEPLLASLRDIELVPLARPDECCGFGGTFAVAEEAVSCMMGRDRVADHTRAGAEVVTATDVSCLMHLAGLARRDGSGLRFMHVAEVFAEAMAGAATAAPRAAAGRTS